MVLARVGVGKISFVDKDSYESSNLSRQLLGSVSDIGKRKVDVAVQNIAFHSLKTDAVYSGHHLNALESWPSVVALAKDSTVIFNCIDDSTGFDFAVNSLSKSLGIPVIQGQSAAWSFNAEFYSGAPGKRCFACSENLKSSFCIEGSAYEAIESRLLLWLQLNRSGTSATILQHWLQEDSHEAFLSDTAAVSSAIIDFLAQDTQYRISGETAKWVVGCALQRTCFDSSTCDSTDVSPDSHSGGVWKFRLFLRHYINESSDAGVGGLPGRHLIHPETQGAPHEVLRIMVSPSASEMYA
jgi:molybdopterin/thiamine biosynthesis adenylyltransferase